MHWDLEPFIDEDYAREIEVENLLHYFRVNHSKEDTTDDEKLTYADFNKRLEIIEKENKDKYKFILKSGQAFKNCIFNLFKKVWESESIPEQWRETIIIQIFKGGHKDPSEYDSQRNIHTKEFLPKVFVLSFSGQFALCAHPYLNKHKSNFKN